MNWPFQRRIQWNLQQDIKTACSKRAVSGPRGDLLFRVLTSVVTKRNHRLQGQQEIHSLCLFSPAPSSPLSGLHVSPRGFPALQGRSQPQYNVVQGRNAPSLLSPSLALFLAVRESKNLSLCPDCSNPSAEFLGSSSSWLFLSSPPQLAYSQGLCHPFSIPVLFE